MECKKKQSCKCKLKDISSGKVKVLLEVLANKKVIRDINNNNITIDEVVGTIWGFIDNKSPYLKTTYGSIENTNITHIITTNYLEILNEKKWFRLNNKVFEVVKLINVNEANTELQLYCKIREQN
jgi:hypothetical protein